MIGHLLNLIYVFLNPYCSFNKILSLFLQSQNMKEKRILGSILEHRFSVYISINAAIDSSVSFPHPTNIVIGWGVKIDSGVTLYQGVTLGIKEKKYWDSPEREKYYPTLEKDVTVYPNSTILGGIVVKEDTIITPNSVVIKNTEKSSIYSGNPAKKIKDNV